MNTKIEYTYISLLTRDDITGRLALAQRIFWAVDDVTAWQIYCIARIDILF